MEFCNFCKAPTEQFSAEHSQIWLGSFSFINISVIEMIRFSILSIKETRPSALTFLQLAILIGLSGVQFSL